MSSPAAAPVPLPAPLRILHTDEYDRVVKAGVRAARSVERATTLEIAEAVLAEVGLFPPPVEPADLDSGYCTAQSLPFEAEACDAHSFGQWQQCGDEPGHDGDEHDNGDFSWSDGQPGTMPALETV